MSSKKIYTAMIIVGIMGALIILAIGCRAEEEPLPVPSPQIEQEEEAAEEPLPEPAVKEQEEEEEEEEIENLYVSSSNLFPNYSFICPDGWEITGAEDGSRILLEGKGQAIAVMVEDVESIEEMETGQIAQKYLEITDELEGAEIIEQDFALGQEKTVVYGYRYDSGLEPDTEQLDLLGWQEKDGYLYILKYMADGLDTNLAMQSFQDFSSTFGWEEEMLATAQQGQSNSINILILGDDSFHDRSGGRISGRTDINILLHINLEHWEAKIITIPRDLWVEIPGRGKNKINAANAIGGPDLTVETFEQFSGLEVDSYIITDMDGFIELIDFLGGVTVEVEENLADGFSGCYLDKGVHHLDGEQALALSRNRQRPGGAFAREEESAKMIVALYEQQTTVAKILKLPAFINHLLNYTWTDMGFSTFIRVLPALGKVEAEDIEITSIPSWPQMVGNVSAVVYDPQATEELFEELQNR